MMNQNIPPLIEREVQNFGNREKVDEGRSSCGNVNVFGQPLRSGFGWGGLDVGCDQNEHSDHIHPQGLYEDNTREKRAEVFERINGELRECGSIFE
jgi:hypothetical protein